MVKLALRAESAQTWNSFAFSPDEADGHEIRAACSCDSGSLYLHALRLTKRGSGGESLKPVILAWNLDGFKTDFANTKLNYRYFYK